MFQNTKFFSPENLLYENEKKPIYGILSLILILKSLRYEIGMPRHKNFHVTCHEEICHG